MKISRREMLRLRLSAQRITGRDSLTIPGVLRQLFATQAQDFVQGGWALGLRATGSTIADLDAALGSGAIIRSAPFRGTLHFMLAGDLGWVLDVTSPRTIQGAAKRFSDLGLDGRALGRAAEVTRAALAGKALTRDDYFAVLRDAGIDPSAQRGYHVIWYLAQTAVVCWGPPLGTQQGLVLVDEWVREPRRLEGDEALRELALRYFTGHGPATVRDFAWWTKLTLAAARRGLELAARDLTELEYDGTPNWASTAELDRAAGGRMSAAVHALPGFDEYLLGYENRSAPLAEEHFEKIVPGLNGIFLPLIVAGGEVVGTWRRAERAAGVTVTPDPFSRLTAAQERSFQKAAAAFARFRTASR
ncbi:MAG: winged helix DNA-binding domain-containing protein [Actinomycetota bacterium]